MYKKYFILPLGGSGGGGTAVVVDELPAVEEAKANVIYMIVKEDAEEQDYYDEWMVVEKDGVKQWEKIGNTKIDLSDYYTKAEIDAKLDDDDDVWDFYQHTQEENKAIYDAIANGQSLPYKYFQISDSEPKKYVGAYSKDLRANPMIVDFYRDDVYTWQGTYTKLSVTIYSLYKHGEFGTRQGNWRAIDIEKFPLKSDIKDSTITIKQGDVEQSFTLNQSDNQTIELQQGGGGNEWFGTQHEWDALGEYDTDTTYYITDLTWEDIKGRPDMAKYATVAMLNDEVSTLDGKITVINNTKLNTADIQYMTQDEFDAIEPLEGVTYCIEGETTTLTFELEDGTTHEYKVLN